MLKAMISAIGFLFLIIIPARSQDLNIQVDVITHLNSPSEIRIDQNIIYSATSGGLLIHDLNSNQSRVFTAANGIFDHNLQAIDRGRNNLLILGSKSGVLTFFDGETETVTNDENLSGETIVDILAIEDSLWVLSKNFISVYLFDETKSRYQFRESYQDFNLQFDRFYAMDYAKGRIWLASDKGLVSAPANFLKFNLYAVNNWRVQTSADGLPSDVVFDVVSGSHVAGADNGALFLATAAGVSRYDFNAFARIPSSNGIRNLYLTGNGLYGATTRQVFRMGDQVETLYTLPNGQITDIALDDVGNVWVSILKRGLQNLKTGQKLVADGPLANHIGEVLVDASGKIWCSAATLGETPNQGIFLLTDAGWQNYFFLGGSSNTYSNLNSSNPVFEDADGNIWIGSWGGGVVIFDPELNYQTINASVDPGKVWISSVSRDDTLDLQTAPELRNVFVSATTKNNFITVITDMFFDTQRQSIWILNYAATNNLPLVEYKDVAFRQSAFSAGSWNRFAPPVNKNETHKLTQDFAGDLWMATSGGVVQIRFDGDQFATATYNENDNMKSDQVNAIAADQDGYVWVGTRTGLNAILGGQVFDFRETFQPIGLKINDIFVDSRNNKWFATDQGLSILKGEGSPFEPSSWIDLVPFNTSLDVEQLGVRSRAFQENLPSEIINSVFVEEKNGDVYLGTDQGLAIIRNNPFASTFSDFAKLKVGPNPFLLNEGERNTLNFRQLVPGSQVKILSINGQLIRLLKRDILDEIRWDGRNEDGKFVATGVYVYMITSENGQETAGKVLVVNQ